MAEPNAQKLQEDIDALLTQLQELSANDQLPPGPTALEQENNRIEKYLSEFTNREGVLLTIASLLSLLPLTNEHVIVPYFLLWVFPFLFTAIISYILSAKRINFVSPLQGKHYSLRGNSAKANISLKSIYYHSLRFHRLTDAAIASFFTAFISSYYFITFNDMPSFVESIIITSLASLAGIMRYLSSKTRDKVSSFLVPTTPTVPLETDRE